MIEINCSNCNRPGQVLSAKGLCWDCYDSKEKQRYRYMINGHTQLLLFTTLLCILFLLNGLPTMYLAHTFTKQYSYIENDYIRHGKDILILTIYAVLKIGFAINLWKSRYQGVGSKYINLASEAVLFILKLGFLFHYLSNPSRWELRLSGLTEYLNLYTEDTISSEYLAFFLIFALLFLFLRALTCIAAYLLNIKYQKHYQEFFLNHPNSKRIHNMARWELHYKSHPIGQKKNETLFVAAKVEKPLVVSEEFLREDLGSYVKDVKQLNRLILNLLSQEDAIEVEESDLSIYFSYVKDKLSQWKEDNLSTDNYLDTEVIDDFTAKLNSIKERFTYCSVENKLYYEILNHYINGFETPLRLMTHHRRNVKLMIEQLYTNSNLLYQNTKSKEALNETLALFDRQAINLCGITLSIDDKTYEFDHILVTNRGIFLIDIRTFDTSVPFDFLIERDGSWLKKIYVDGSFSHLESLDAQAPYENSRNLLIVEKFINEALNRPLDQYIELKHIVIIANSDLYIDNRSMQTVIRVGELISTLRSYPIILNEERMKQIETILTNALMTSISYPIPNYRKIIIDQLDELLEKKLQILRENSSLIHQVSVVACDLGKKHKLSFLPLIIH